MNRFARIALGTAGLAIGMAVAGAAPAGAQVQVAGSFPVPFGQVTVGFPVPPLPVPPLLPFAIGACVPYGYVVVNDPYDGYGFVYGGHWISCRSYGGRWVVVQRTPYVAHAGGSAWHGTQHFDRGHVASRSFDRRAGRSAGRQVTRSSRSGRRGR